MSAKSFKILQKLEDRLKDIAETVGECTATLYGTKFENTLLVLGLSIQNESNFTIEHNNPYGVNLLGVAEIRKSISDDDICAKVKDIPLNPIVLNVSTVGSIKSRRLVDGKLTPCSFDMLEDDEFLSSFMFVNFVTASTGEEAADNQAEPAEEATELSSNPSAIKEKILNEPPVFKIPDGVTLSSDITPIDTYNENPNDKEKDPRLPEDLAILTVQLEFPYNSKFLRKADNKDGVLDNINTAALVLRDDPVNLTDLLIGSLSRLLKCFESDQTSDEIHEFSSHIFFPIEIGYLVSVIFPSNVQEDVLLKKRLILHETFGLSTVAPRFTLSLALSHYFGTSPAIGYSGERHLQNVHEAVKPPKLKDAQIVTVRGLYNYFHYLQDGEKDDGWGCAYRSLQTIFSWFLWQGYVSSQVPSIRQIQETLVKIKDKPDSFVGSKQWIGSQELCYVLDETAKVMCRIIHVPSGKGMLEERYSIAAHFEEQGTPIMVGGGQYAYTILGIACSDTPSETRFLILDPHYVGPHDLKSILKKNGVAWKAVDLFKNGQFYNMCLPLASSAF